METLAHSVTVISLLRHGAVLERDCSRLPDPHRVVRSACSAPGRQPQPCCSPPKRAVLGRPRHLPGHAPLCPWNSIRWPTQLGPDANSVCPLGPRPDVVLLGKTRSPPPTERVLRLPSHTLSRRSPRHCRNPPQSLRRRCLDLPVAPNLTRRSYFSWRLRCTLGLPHPASSHGPQRPWPQSILRALSLSAVRRILPASHISRGTGS